MIGKPKLKFEELPPVIDLRLMAVSRWLMAAIPNSFVSRFGITAISHQPSAISRAFGILLLALSCWIPAAAQEIEARRVFVPVEDLDTIIAKDQRGVLLPRDEFLKLYRDAQKNAPMKTTAPVGAVISGATYSAKFEGEQLVVEATIKISQLADSWQALPLPLGAMAVESAKLNGQPARLGRNEQTLFLLSDTRGEHTLTLELSTPLSAVGADKVASVGVLPGNSGNTQGRGAGGEAFATRGALCRKTGRERSTGEL